MQTELPHLGWIKWPLALIALALTASTVAWTVADKTPPAWDPADHIVAAYDYYVPLARLNFKAFAQEYFFTPHYYAPLVHIITAFILLIFGASRVTGIAVNFLSLIVLLLSVYWICGLLYSRRGGSREPGSKQNSYRVAGLLAGLLATCYHFPAWLLHDAFLDYPLIAIVSLAFALLIRADDFRDWRPAAMFGVAAGLGMLTKQTFAFFFVLPMLYVVVKVLLTRSPRAMANLILSALVAVAVAAIWYAPHMNDVIEIYQVNRQAAVSENEAPLFTLRSNLFYTHALLSTQMQLPFAGLFAIGLIYSLVRRRSESLILYLWLVSGIGIFTLIANKDPRYTVPVLPAAALLSTFWIDDLKTLFTKSPLLLRAGRFSTRPVIFLRLVLVSAISIWAFVSFHNAQWPRDGMGYYIDMPDFRWMVFGRNYFGLDHRPLPFDWGVPGSVRAVVEEWKREKDELKSGFDRTNSREPDATGLAREAALQRPGDHILDRSAPVVGVVVNLPHINPSSFALYTRLMAGGRAASPVANVDWLIDQPAADRINQCDFILVRTGLDRAEWLAPLERFTEELIKANPDRFTRVAAFPIPLEQAEAVVYRCTTGRQARQ